MKFRGLAGVADCASVGSPGHAGREAIPTSPAAPAFRKSRRRNPPFLFLALISASLEFPRIAAAPFRTLHFSCRWSDSQRQIKKLARVAEANAANDRPEQSFIVGQKAFLHFLADQVAKNPAEVFVPRE